MNKKETGCGLSLFYGVGGLRWYTAECLRGVALIRLLRSHLPPRGRLFRMVLLCKVVPR